MNPALENTVANRSARSLAVSRSRIVSRAARMANACVKTAAANDHATPRSTAVSKGRWNDDTIRQGVTTTRTNSVRRFTLGSSSMRALRENIPKHISRNSTSVCRAVMHSPSTIRVPLFLIVAAFSFRHFKTCLIFYHI